MLLERGVSMIYTLTLAPALDYVQHVKSFSKGIFNRGYKDSMQPGGKGINVSIVLKRLGVESIALGFIGGFVGDYLLECLHAEGIENNFVKITGTSRINFKILADDDHSETQINGVGPLIPFDKMDELMNILQEIKDGDTLVMDGQVPPGFGENTYQMIFEALKGKNISFVLDTTGKFLTDCLKYHPFLIKPNFLEMQDIFKRPMKTEKEIYDGIKELQKMGATNVIVSRGKDGALMIDDQGKKYKRGSFSGKPISTFGAGDAMIGGFLCGWQLFRDYDKALDVALACGTARAMTGHHPTKEEVLKYYDLLQGKKK